MFSGAVRYSFLPASPGKSPSGRNFFRLSGELRFLDGIKKYKQASRKQTLQEILDLSRDALERLLKRLTHHALCKMRHLTWRGAYVARGGSVPGGYEPYDFALDAIAKTMEGGRPWNHEKYPTLESHLRSIIDSDISHLVESVDNSSGRRLSPQSFRDETVAAYEVPGTEPNPLVMVIDRDWQTRFHYAAMNELKDESFLIKLLECMEAEITEPAEIAEVLGVTVEHVNNEKKKLRRRLDKLHTRIKPTKKRTGS